MKVNVGKCVGEEKWTKSQLALVMSDGCLVRLPHDRFVTVNGSAHVEAFPGTTENSAFVVAGPVATVRDENRTHLLALISYLNGFRVSDCLFSVASDGSVVVLTEVCESAGGNSLAKAVEATSEAASDYSCYIEAVATGRRELAGVIWLLRQGLYPKGIERRAVLERFLHRDTESACADNVSAFSSEAHIVDMKAPGLIDLVHTPSGKLRGIVRVDGSDLPLDITPLESGGCAEVRLRLMGHCVDKDRAADYALKVAALSEKDATWEDVCVDPFDGETVYLVQAVTPNVEAAIREAISWALEHRKECLDLGWGTKVEQSQSPRDMLLEMLGEE